MKFCLTIVLPLFLVTGTLTQASWAKSDGMCFSVGKQLTSFSSDSCFKAALCVSQHCHSNQQIYCTTPCNTQTQNTCFHYEGKTQYCVAGGGGVTEFDLSDAFDDVAPTPAKPKEQPKAPEKPKTDGGFGLDLEDALGPDPNPKPDKPAVNPPKSGGGGFGLDLEDALGPDPNPKPDKPAVNPPKSGGGGGTFGDSDLLDVSGGDYKPDGGRSGGDCSMRDVYREQEESLIAQASFTQDDHGRAMDPGNDPQGGADQPQEAGSGQIAGIVSAIGVALLGAASSYFAYQKKKLCFKLQGGADPESGKGHHGTQSDPQVFSNLLRTS